MLCVGCQSSHFYAQKGLIKPTILLTRTQKQTNIQSSQSSSKYHANTVRTLACLTESPHIHITSYSYILITLNYNKPRRQLWQLFDRRGACATECKRVSHAEKAHVTTTKLHTSTSTTAKLQTICPHRSSQLLDKLNRKCRSKVEPSCTTMCYQELVHFEDGAAKH